MVKKLEPEDPDLHSKALDDFGIGLITQTTDSGEIASMLIEYLYGLKDYPVEKKQVHALLKRYDCDCIITIEKMYKAADKLIEEHKRKLFYRKIYEESCKKKAGGTPPNGK